MTGKDLIKMILPPIALSALRHISRRPPLEPIRFIGDYQSWEEAQRTTGSGYAAPEILAKTRAALMKVKKGEAAFERDSVVFTEMQYDFPLLAGLLRAASSNENRLSVLDFGGALGGTYFRCRDFLTSVDELHWSVVEQPAHVACGETEFANHQLRFYRTLEECVRTEQPNLLLLSSVLPYLPRPYEFLRDLLRHEFNYVIVDRTAFTARGRDRLTVQHVPSWIYEASYPAWFFSEARLRACFDGHYGLVCEFPRADIVHLDGDEVYFKGFHFQIKAQTRRP